MKRTLLLFLFVLIFAAPTLLQAQNGRFMNHTPEERSAKFTSWMQDYLNLTPTQTDKISVLNLSYANEMEKLKSDNISRIKKVSVVKNVDKRRTADFKKILTPDQFNKYIEKKKEVMETLRQFISEYKRKSK